MNPNAYLNLMLTAKTLNVIRDELIEYHRNKCYPCTEDESKVLQNIAYFESGICDLENSSLSDETCYTNVDGTLRA